MNPAVFEKLMPRKFVVEPATFTVRKRLQAVY